jgi:formate dehydrogenase iron-sulfur subunit
MSKAILYDATRCIGCKQCEAACAETHHLPYDERIAAEQTTSDHKYTYVATIGNDKYMRHLCMHCVDPSCASVCPVGALQKTKDGPVTYDEDKCMGCRYCMLACPFGIPKYEWSKLLPGVRKCSLCAERAAGQPTACSEACPTGATITGDRKELLAEALERIRQNPDQYVNHVFGQTEVGGTSTLLVSGVPFEKFGFNANYEQAPLPRLTYNVLSRIPDLASLGFVLLGGVWWITNRRAEVAAAEGRPPLPKNRVEGENP